jgi:hypothetical protein
MDMKRKGTQTEKIISKALALLLLQSSGLRYSELVRKLSKEFPSTPVNSIHGIVWNLDQRLPEQVYKPDRGIFRHSKYKDKEIDEKDLKTKDKKIREEYFYKPFKDWLIIEMEECTKAMVLGGNKFKDKWGTPDVIGVKESDRTDIVQFSTEIISAEIKIDSKDLITAFGQACSYKLFSHKSYIVVPNNSPQEDKSKLDSLCLIFGIGLIFFNNNNVDFPQFEIRVRPIKHEPDMFYVNKYLKIIEKELFSDNIQYQWRRRN